MIFVYPKAYLELLEELSISVAEWEDLESLLTAKEVEILEVIITKHTRAEYLLFFKEMCSKLNSKGKLPTKYKKYL